MASVKVKVIGKRTDVDRCLSVIDQTFELTLKSRVIEHPENDDVHCFVELNPYALRKKSEIGQERE